MFITFYFFECYNLGLYRMFQRKYTRNAANIYVPCSTQGNIEYTREQYCRNEKLEKMRT